MVVSRSDAKRRKRPEGDSLPDSPKRTKVHAQRKFAQGSHMNSPVLTPVKDKDKVKFNGALANAELAPAKRPKTEEFVNFLCFRGSDMLPKSLEFFNKPAAPENLDHSRRDHPTAGPSRANTRNNDKQLDQITVVAKAEAKPRNKQKSIPAVQALKKKYQEQRKAKEKITLTKLALKAKGKNMMRTRSAGPLDEAPTSSLLKKPLKSTKLMASVKSKVVATKPAIRKHAPPHKRTSSKPVTRGGLRSGGTLPVGSDFGLKNERKPKKIFKLKSSVMAKNVRKPDIASSLSDFSSDDDQPLVKKQRVVASHSSRVVTRSRITHSQLKRPIRPTRKTKEAATAYMEMLGKELVSPEEDIEEATTKEIDERSKKTAGKRNALRKPLAKNKITKTQNNKNLTKEISLSASEKSKEEIIDSSANTSLSSIKTRNVTKTLSKTVLKEGHERNIKPSHKLRPVSVTITKTLPKDCQQVNVVKDVILSKSKATVIMSGKTQLSKKGKDTKQNSSLSVKSSRSKNYVENTFNDSDEEPLNNKVNVAPHSNIGSGSRITKVLDSKESIPEEKLIKGKTDKAVKDISKEQVKSTNRSSSIGSKDITNKGENESKTELLQQSKPVTTNSKNNSDSEKNNHSNNKNKVQTRLEHDKPDSVVKDNNKNKRKSAPTNSKEINNPSKQNRQEKGKLSIERRRKIQSSLRSTGKNKTDESQIVEDNVNYKDGTSNNESVSTRNSCKLSKNNINDGNCKDKSSSIQFKDKPKDEPKQKTDEQLAKSRNKNDVDIIQDTSLNEICKNINNKQNETETSSNISTKMEDKCINETMANKHDLNKECIVEMFEIKQIADKDSISTEENMSSENGKWNISGLENKPLGWEANKIESKEEGFKSETNVTNELSSEQLKIDSVNLSQVKELENTILLDSKNKSLHEKIGINKTVTLIGDKSQSPEEKIVEIIDKNVDNLRNIYNLDLDFGSQLKHVQGLGRNKTLLYDSQSSKTMRTTLPDGNHNSKNKEMDLDGISKANKESAQSDGTAKSNFSSTIQNVTQLFNKPNSNTINSSSEGINSSKVHAGKLSTAESSVFESSSLPAYNEGTAFNNITYTKTEGYSAPRDDSVQQEDNLNCIQTNVNKVLLNKYNTTVKLNPVDKGTSGKLIQNYHEYKEESIGTLKVKLDPTLNADSDKKSTSINKDILGSLNFQGKDIHINNKTSKEVNNEQTGLIIEAENIQSCFISKSDHHEMSEKLSAVDSLMRLKNTKKFIEKDDSSGLDVKFMPCKKSPEVESKRMPSDNDNKESKRVKFLEPDVKLFHEGDYKRFTIHESDVKHSHGFEHETKRNQLQDIDFKRFQQQDYKPKPEHSQVLKGCANPKSMLKPGTLIDIAGISHSPEIMAPLRPGLDGEIIPMSKPIKLEASDIHFSANTGAKVYDPKTDQHMSGYVRQTEKKRIFDQAMDKDVSDNKARAPVNESAWRQAFKNVKDPKSPNVNVPAEKQVIRKPALSVTALAKKHKPKPGVGDKNISYQPSIPFLRQNKVFLSSPQAKIQSPNKTSADKKSLSSEIDSKTLRQKEAEVEEFVRQYVTGELSFPPSSSLQSSSNVAKVNEKAENKLVESTTININNEESFLETKEISKMFHTKLASENTTNKNIAVLNKQKYDELPNQKSSTTSSFFEGIKRTNSPPINPNRKCPETQSNNFHKRPENVIPPYFTINSPKPKEQSLDTSGFKPEDSKVKTAEVHSSKNETSLNTSSSVIPLQQGSKNLINTSLNVYTLSKNNLGSGNVSLQTFAELRQNIINSTLHKGGDNSTKECFQPDQPFIKSFPPDVVTKSLTMRDKSSKNVNDRNNSPILNRSAVNENDSLRDLSSRCQSNTSSLPTGHKLNFSAEVPNYLTGKKSLKDNDVSFSSHDDSKIFQDSMDSGMCKDVTNETGLSVNNSSVLRNSLFTEYATSDNHDSTFERDKPPSFFDSACQVDGSRTSDSNANRNTMSQSFEYGEAKHFLPVPVDQHLKNSTAMSSTKKGTPKKKDEINESSKTQCNEQTRNVCDNVDDDNRKVESDLKKTPKASSKLVSGIYSHSEPQELDLMLKRKVNMSTEEIKRWINESSQSILEHIPNCRYLENNVCECEYRNSSFPGLNTDGFHDQGLIKSENCSSPIDHVHAGVDSKSEKELTTTTDILSLQHVDQSCSHSENSNVKQCNEQQNIRVKDFSEIVAVNTSPEKGTSKSLLCDEKEIKDQAKNIEPKERNINLKSVKSSPAGKSQNHDELQPRKSITESNKINSLDSGIGNKHNVPDGNSSNLLDYPGTYPHSPKDDNSFLNDVSSSNDETPEKSNLTERKSIFNQRRSLLKVKERKELLGPPSTNAFSPENESSVYAFDPELPPTSTPFRRSKGKDSKTNNSSTDENESVPSSNSIAVQVNFDNETVLECSTQTDAQEGDDDDPNTFYIPLQQNNMDVSKPPLIQGVAVKLDTEGPNQKVIMRAKLVTKPLSTFSQSSSSRAVIGSKSGKPEQKVRPLSKLPVGTVQPTARPKPKPSVPDELPGPSKAKVASPQATRLAKRTKVKSAAPAASVSEHQSPKVAPAKLVEAPTFYPTEKEFEDPLEYIESITPSAEKYGLCRVVPPSNFKPECRVSDDMRFTAYNQYIHKMLHRWGPNVKEMLAIKRYLATQSISLKNPPLIGGMEVDLPRLYQTVQSCGGLKEVIEKKRWHRVADAMKIPKSAQDRVTKLDDIYCKFLLPYDTLSHAERTQLMDDVEKYWIEREKRVACSEEDSEDDDSSDSDIDECILKGRSMALNAFYRIARNTMSMWFNKTENPPASDVELEFWKHVASRQHHVCVHAGSIDSGSMGYGFPTGKNSSTSRHPWNLKMLTNNPGSILRFLGPIMGVTVPTLHVGMLFSACCWYRDPHGLPWIEYLHTGASKIWYGIPDSSSSQLRDAVESIVPRLCRDKTLWLASDTAMVPPPLLVERGVSLSRIVQDPGQFIIVFPKSYTSSVCTGYLVSESVYFAQPSWLLTAHKLFNEMKESSEPTVFSLDKLLFSIVNDSRSSVSLLTKIFPIVVSLRDGEIAGRRQLEELGVNASERLNTNKRRKSRQTSEEEEDYECDECRTNLFISFMSNSHDGAAYCLPHAVNLLTHKRSQVKYCSLVYAFSEDELEDLVEKLKSRVENKSQKKVQSKSSKS